jgi:prevent-host-death family protein
MRFTVHAAKTHLSKLIEAALAGEEVVIARGDKPVVKLVPIEKASFRTGLLACQLTDPPPDFLEPMSEDELSRWEGAD